MNQITLFALVGFIAQLIDGALGMAYGVSASVFLLSLGVSPLVTSASVHVAEVFTTGVSGFMHWRFGNTEKALVKGLLVPGVVGALTGAYALPFVPENLIQLFVSVYLLVMGWIIIQTTIQRAAPAPVPTPLTPLGLVGGFFDAVAGGGWGQIVVATLVARGYPPRNVIGSTNLAEFLVSLAASITFISTIGLSYWQAVLGLAVGGVLAAPLAAYVCKIAPPRLLMPIVGLLIIALSAKALYFSLMILG